MECPVYHATKTYPVNIALSGRKKAVRDRSTLEQEKEVFKP